MVISRLQDPGLWRQQARIGADWCGADTGGTVEVRNPFDRSVLGTVPDMGAAETRRAIEAAGEASGGWAARPAGERANLLRALHDAMLAHREDLAVLMTLEGGKAIREARAEIDYSASFIGWYAEEARRAYGEIIPGHQADTRILVSREPVGVAALITPWNFPSAMLGRKLGPALAAGCTVVAKPATQTPYSALALAVLADRVGIPPGVINIVTGQDAAAIGKELCSNPDVAKLSFTGSTGVGRTLAAQCAGTLKRVSLELGGNAPFLVFDDADLDAAVEGAIASKFRNSGQTCVCANRFLVQAGIHDRFVEALVAASRRLVVGNGLDEHTDLGPLIDEKGLEKVQAHVADARGHGAQVLLGGEPHPLGGTFYPATVLTGATPALRLAREETFGPVAAVFRFEEEEEGIALANDTEAGLASYAYTRDLARSWRVREGLRAGIVGINTGLISTTVAPFGGIKQSGLGREGSRHGLDEYLELKYTCIGGMH